MGSNNNKPYRDLSDVIVKSLEIIPKSETLLIDNLTWLLSSYHYTENRFVHLRWKEFTRLLNLYLPKNPETEWQERLQHYVNNK
jgi:hypothetical protein